MALSHLLPGRQSFPRWEPQASKLLEVSVAAWMLLFKSWWRGSLEKNLKNKYSDSSLLFRLSSRKSQPRAPETKGNIQHWAGSAPVRSPDCQWGGGEGGSRLQNPEQGLALKGQCVLVLPPRREGGGRMNNLGRCLLRADTVSYSSPEQPLANCSSAGAAVRSRAWSGVSRASCSPG